MVYGNKIGVKYVGEWQNNKRSSLGRLVHFDIYDPSKESELYSGTWENDMRHGIGCAIARESDRAQLNNGWWLAPGDRYCGQWAHDLKEGLGEYTAADTRRACSQPPLAAPLVAPCAPDSELCPWCVVIMSCSSAKSLRLCACH
ncbi:hypothetical protein CYMTET_26840 [Cymbomonas tetramitiformis]|uniref:Uncharacterized protein n=1 Tax=Cymbomonas tetramitiformis TaxID=36881 RepID=A0AAE0KXL1_9CHLO|nr:hypothetical protein CYMTET_26840 [Cymbomonas tetramitiformis]